MTALSRSEEHTSELQSLTNLVCRLLLDTPTTEIYTLSLHDALPILSPDFYINNWSNLWPHSSAPAPFRVSADGKACAIVAGSNQPTALPSTLFLQRSVYVDYDGTFQIGRAHV